MSFDPGGGCGDMTNGGAICETGSLCHGCTDAALRRRMAEVKRLQGVVVVTLIEQEQGLQMLEAVQRGNAELMAEVERITALHAEAGRLVFQARWESERLQGELTSARRELADYGQEGDDEVVRLRTECERLILELCDRARESADAHHALARVSTELGLPTGIGPAPGALLNIIRENERAWARVRAQDAELALARPVVEAVEHDCGVKSPGVAAALRAYQAARKGEGD